MNEGPKYVDTEDSYEIFPNEVNFLFPLIRRLS